MEEKLSKKHTFNMIERNKVTMTGIINVFSFDEENIELESTKGYLELKGSELHIIKMNLDDTEVIVEGNISEVIYHDYANQSGKKGSFMSKIFK